MFDINYVITTLMTAITLFYLGLRRMINTDSDCFLYSRPYLDLK